MPSPLSSVGALDSVIPLAAVRDLDRPTDGTEAPFAGLMAQYTAVPPAAAPPTEVESTPPSLGLDGVEAARGTPLRGADAGTPAGPPEVIQEAKAPAAAPLPPEVPIAEVPIAEARAAIPAPMGAGTLLLPPAPPPLALPGPLAAGPPPSGTPSAAPQAAVTLDPQPTGLVDPILQQPTVLPPPLPTPSAKNAPAATGDAQIPELPPTVSLVQPAPPAGTPRSAGPQAPDPLPQGHPQAFPGVEEIPEPSILTQALRPGTVETLKPVAPLLPETPSVVAPVTLPRDGIKALPAATPETQTQDASLPSSWVEPAAPRTSSAEVQPQQFPLKRAVPLESRPPAPAGPTLLETPRSRADAPEAPLELAKQLPSPSPVPPAAESTQNLPAPGLGQAEPAPAARAILHPNPELAPVSQPVLAQVAPKPRPVRLGEVEETPRPEPEIPLAPRTVSAIATGTPSSPPLPKTGVVPVRSPLAQQEPVASIRGKEAKEVQAAPDNRPAKPTTEPAPEAPKRPLQAPEAALPTSGPTHVASPSSPLVAPPPLTHPVTPLATSLLPATPAAPAHPVVIQVGDSLKWILRQASTSAELQLHPENLGKVTIQLKVEGTQVHAKVWATEASTLPVLQDHRAYLEVSLRQQGLHLGSFDLQQGHRGHQHFGDTPSRPAFAPLFEDKVSLARQETPSTLAPAFASSHRIEVLA